jgi:hypothetical protein
MGQKYLFKIFLLLTIISTLYSQFTPYRDPFTASIGEYSGSIQIADWQDGGNLILDSLSHENFNQSFYNRLVYMSDVSLLRMNWLYLVWPQAIVDMQTGAGFRYWGAQASRGLPGAWPDTVFEGTNFYTNLLFQPSGFEFYVDNQFIYPFRSWMNITAGTYIGFGDMALYRDADDNRTLKSTGTNWGFNTGFEFLRKNDATSKIKLGARFKYDYKTFDYGKTTLNDALAGGGDGPIQSVNMSHFTVSVHVGVLFGGSKNLGHSAYEKIQKGLYLEGVKDLKRFVRANPGHHNIKRAHADIKKAERMFYYQYIELARKEMDAGNLGVALEYLDYKDIPEDENLRREAATLVGAIGSKYLEQSAQKIKRGEFDASIDFVKDTGKAFALQKKLLPDSLHNELVLDDYSAEMVSRATIAKAVMLYEAGMYDQAIYWADSSLAMNDKYASEVKELKRLISMGLVKDARTGVKNNNPVFVSETLKEAKEMNPLLASILNESIGDLDKTIQKQDESAMNILKSLELSRSIIPELEGIKPENFIPKNGMTKATLLRYGAEPHKKYLTGKYELWIYKRENASDYYVYLFRDKVEKIERK